MRWRCARRSTCIQDQVETIYDVAHAAKTGYEWLSGKLQLFLAVREELRKE